MHWERVTACIWAWECPLKPPKKAVGFPGALDTPSFPHSSPLPLFSPALAPLYLPLQSLPWADSQTPGKSLGISGAFGILQEPQGPVASESGRSWETSITFSFPFPLGDPVSRPGQRLSGMMMAGLGLGEGWTM